MKIRGNGTRGAIALIALGATLMFVSGCDGKPPETSIDSKPSDPDNTGSASFTFSSNKDNSTFECNLDGAGFTSCTSPQEYANLSSGSHTFEVRATAEDRIDASPASYTWTVEPIEAQFRITLNGFKVNNETFDHQFEVDGKGDEVYIRYDTRMVDAEENTLLSNNAQTVVMGDVNGHPERVQAGSRDCPGSCKGGLKSGDAFPDSTPWDRSGSNMMADHPPMILFEGTLVKDETGVAITPTIWEWDGATDILQSWGATISENGPKIAQATANIIKGETDDNKVIQSNLEMGLPAVFDLLSDIGGRAQDRAIGGVPTNQDKDFKFEPKTLVFTYDKAVLATQNNPSGKGVGVFEISYADPPGQIGNYTLYIQIERM